MPRYNTSLDSNTIAGTTTIGSPDQGDFTTLTGASGYTVTLPAPFAFPGSNFTFYNATSPAGVVTISTPSGSFSGTGGPNASTYNISAGNVISVTSDGSNYIVISEDGSPLTATTGAFTGNVEMTGGLSVTGSGTLSLNPSSTGSINNTNIGASTRGTGAFTSLSANAAVTLTANTASSSTTTGTLVVTGGIGASGTVNATTVAATTLTGTVSTAAQPNITSTGNLTVPSLIVDASSTTRLKVGDNSSTITLQSDYSNPLIVERTGNSGKGAIVFRGSDTIGTAIEQGRTNSASHWGTYLSFLVHDNDTVDLLSVKERFRVNASGASVTGSLGVGTPTPTATLDVRGGIAVSGWSNNNGGTAGGVELGWDGTQSVFQSYNRSGNAYTPVLVSGSTIKISPSGTQQLFANSTGVVVGSMTSPEGKLHVQHTSITAAAPSLGWPNYVNPDADTNARIVAIFDTAGNGNVATAGQGPTVVIRVGSYYDSRAVISPIGAGGASPSDQGTARGKDLMVRGGTSDNGNGLVGGRLFLNGGAGYNGGAFGARGFDGDVRIQNQGGNTFIGRNITNISSAGNNSLYLPFAYNDSGEYAPQRASGMLHIGSFTHRADNQYLDIRTNNNSGSLMFMFHIYGYLYNSANINTWIGGYSYLSNSILNLYVQNLGNCSATAYRTSNGFLCLKINRNASGYSEGKLNVFFHSWSQGEMENMAVTSYAQNNSGSNFYTS
jgi:hypothetical protein